MAFQIEEFVGKLPGGGARPNLFEVDITLPTGISLKSGATLKDLKYLCQTTVIPNGTIGVAQLNYFGRLVKFPGNRTFTDWTCTIINDTDFSARRAIESWMDQISGNITNTRSPLTAAGGYKGTATVTQYSSTGRPIRDYLVRGIFPIEMAAIALDWNTNDAIETFDMTFSIEDWISQDSSLAQGVSSLIDTASVALDS